MHNIKIHQLTNVKLQMKIWKKYFTHITDHGLFSLLNKEHLPMYKKQ